METLVARGHNGIVGLYAYMWKGMLLFHVAIYHSYMVVLYNIHVDVLFLAILHADGES